MRESWTHSVSPELQTDLAHPALSRPTRAGARSAGQVQAQEPTPQLLSQRLLLQSLKPWARLRGELP